MAGIDKAANFYSANYRKVTPASNYFEEASVLPEVVLLPQRMKTVT